MSSRGTIWQQQGADWQRPAQRRDARHQPGLPRVEVVHSRARRAARAASRRHAHDGGDVAASLGDLRRPRPATALRRLRSRRVPRCARRCGAPDVRSRSPVDGLAVAAAAAVRRRGADRAARLQGARPARPGPSAARAARALRSTALERARGGRSCPVPSSAAAGAARGGDHVARLAAAPRGRVARALRLVRARARLGRAVDVAARAANLAGAMRARPAAAAGPGRRSSSTTS